MQKEITMNRLTALSVAIGLAFASSVAMAGDTSFAWITQTGTGNNATVDQTAANNANNALRIGSPAGGVLPGWAIDHNTVTQVGNTNAATVTQAGNGVTDITGQVYQQGNSNMAVIDMSGTNNWAYVSSYGNGNTGIVGQGGGTTGASAHILQGTATTAGNNNASNISQTNTNGEYLANAAVTLPGGGAGSSWSGTNIVQYGNTNIGSIYQTGNTNSSSDIIQSGNGNNAGITQNSVNARLATIEQYGNGNHATTFTSGDADSSIVQIGDANLATSSQIGGLGNANSVVITQTGGGHNANVAQNGGGNHATIRQ
jgi:Curlin associated repeat